MTFLSQHNIYVFCTQRDPILLIYILHLLIIFDDLELKFYLQNIYKFIYIFLEVFPIWSLLIKTLISCTFFCCLFITSFCVAIFSFSMWFIKSLNLYSSARVTGTSHNKLYSFFICLALLCTSLKATIYWNI